MLVPAGRQAHAASAPSFVLGVVLRPAIPFNVCARPRWHTDNDTTMANARLDLKKIRNMLAERRWAKRELYERMQAAGWEGGWRGFYNVLDDDMERHSLDFADALAQALRVPITEIYIPTRVESWAEWRDRGS